MQASDVKVEKQIPPPQAAEDRGLRVGMTTDVFMGAGTESNFGEVGFPQGKR